ncbi:methylamine utilization protein [Pseudoxanthomonas sp. NC8]|nr:methylamine utilization protein [Pseudoxanthomonas sp. NC8]
MRKQAAAFWILALLGAPAAAAELDVHVIDSKGQPVADAVVTVVAAGAQGEPRRAPLRGTSPRMIDQKALVFAPYVEVFRPGEDVVYRNSDRTRHHVYSFSPIKAFEFVLAPGETSAPLKLDRTGVIAVGCNIHDGMINYLYISDAPWIARTGSDGATRFHDVPAGQFDVRVWHPRLPPSARTWCSPASRSARTSNAAWISR